MNCELWKRIHILFLVFYSVLLFTIMYNSGETANVGGLPYIQKIVHSTNLIPLYNIGSVKQVLCSMIIYVPFGILLPNIDSRYNIRKVVYISSAIFISTVEVMQVVLLKGYCDINDVLFGMFGVALVFEGIRWIKLKL